VSLKLLVILAEKVEQLVQFSFPSPFVPWVLVSEHLMVAGCLLVGVIQSSVVGNLAAEVGMKPAVEEGVPKVVGQVGRTKVLLKLILVV